MKRALARLLLLLSFSPSILAQVSVQESILYGITDMGKFITIDRDTGAGTLVWDLPYSGVDSLAFVNGWFYASHGAFAGGGDIVKFTTQPGSDVDLGPTFIGAGPQVAYSIEDMAVGPNGRVYVAYNDTQASAPSPANKIGVLTITDAGCSITFRAQPIGGGGAFNDLDAISFDRLGNFWIVNILPGRWGQMLLPSGQVLNDTPIPNSGCAARWTGLTAFGRAQDQVFYATMSASDFGESCFVTVDKNGGRTFIGMVGFGFDSVTGLALVPQRRILKRR